MWFCKTHYLDGSDAKNHAGTLGLPRARLDSYSSCVVVHSCHAMAVTASSWTIQISKDLKRCLSLLSEVACSFCTQICITKV